MKRKIDLLQSNESKTFLNYLVPSVSATIMISFNYFVDTLCIGQKLGEKGLAALNISWPITTLLYSVGLMLGVGGGAMFSSYMAKGEKKQARSVYTSALLTLISIAAFITILGLVFLKPIVEVLGGIGELKQNVTNYVKWVLIFSIAYMGECFYTSFLRNDKAPKISMMGNFLACILNIIFDVLFVFVFEWGMAGAALASSLAVTSTVILGVCTTFRKKSNLKISFVYFHLRQILCIIKVGLSTFLSEIDGGIVTFVYNIVIIRISGEMSTTIIAIYGIVVNINTIVLAAINGISNAMQPIVSANSGAGKLFRVKRITNLAVKWAIGMSIILVIGIEWKAELLVRIFINPDEEFLRHAAFAVRLVGSSYVLAAANMILVSYFQSIQASRQAIYFSFLRTLFLPIMYVIGGAFFLGIKGVWLSSILLEATTIVVLFLYYIYYQRRRMEKNLAQLNFYDIVDDVDSVDVIIEQLGADNLASYCETMQYCLKRDTANEGIPMIIGLDDLTKTGDVFYEGSKEDEKMGFNLAVGALLFTDLYDQTEGALEMGNTAIIPAMSALAEKFFHFELYEEEERVELISYRKAIPKRKIEKGEENEQ